MQEGGGVSITKSLSSLTQAGKGNVAKRPKFFNQNSTNCTYPPLGASCPMAVRGQKPLCSEYGNNCKTVSSYMRITTCLHIAWGQRRGMWVMLFSVSSLPISMPAQLLLALSYCTPPNTNTLPPPATFQLLHPLPTIPSSPGVYGQPDIAMPWRETERETNP